MIHTVERLKVIGAVASELMSMEQAIMCVNDLIAIIQAEYAIKLQ
ncbi:hypothetical protein VCHA51O444_10585 [Vibrio chagasii]|nr:hypothetical protein VCHA51O444_10585 [Vibrio chagasii]